jgi:hypothetical protein
MISAPRSGSSRPFTAEIAQGEDADRTAEIPQARTTSLCILVRDDQPCMLWLMPQFIIRVELYEANGEDYLRLHAAMDGRGFKSTIVLEDDSVCMLPTAEYLLLSSSLTTQQVLSEAQSAARTVSSSFGVIAVQVAEAPWVSGLKPAR